MTCPDPLETGELPAWLPLLQRPYKSLLGSKNSWDMRLPDGSPVRIERGSQGLNNTLFRVRLGTDVFACKLFVDDERQRAWREWTALRALRAAGVALAPEPVAYAPNGPLPQPVVIVRWTSGTPLTETTLSPETLEQVVDALSAIHRTPPLDGGALPAWHQPESFAAYLSEITSYMDQIRGWAASAQSKSADLPGWVAGLLSLAPLLDNVSSEAANAVAHARTGGAFPTRSLVRADGNLDNIQRDPAGNLLFVDWGCSGWGDPAYDLAELRWHPRGLAAGQAEWDRAVATYPDPPGDPTFGERLAVYNALLPAWWVGRSAVHLLEGAGQLGGSSRLISAPLRMYRRVREQLDVYLAALNLIEPPAPPEKAEEDD